VNASVKTLLSLGGVYALAALAARPWMERSGATGDERRRPLSGDELVADANEQTHAITIDAAPAAVWPWLVQMGQGRAGFYSHDRLERLVGAEIRNADRIHPEWQQLAVGDLMRTYRPMPRFEPLGWLVSVVDPERVLVLHEPARNGLINSSWALVLEEAGRGRTRLLSRWRFRRRGLGDALFKRFVFDPPHFVMETGVLRGIKQRAEQPSESKNGSGVAVDVVPESDGAEVRG
jgi:hypothetical protein